MKTLNLLKKSIGICIASLPVIANGATGEFLNNLKTYVGFGSDYNAYKLHKDITEDDGGAFFAKRNTNGLSLAVPAVGVKLHDNFGIEAGYSFNKKFQFKTNKLDNTDIYGEYKVKVRNMYLDLIGYLPISEKFDIIGGVGLGYLKLKGDRIVYRNVPAGASISTTMNHKNKTGWRVKLGTQYNISENCGIRVLAIYQHVNNKVKATTLALGPDGVALGRETGKFVKNIKSIGLTAIYSF